MFSLKLGVRRRVAPHEKGGCIALAFQEKEGARMVGREVQEEAKGFPGHGGRIVGSLQDLGELKEHSGAVGLRLGPLEGAPAGKEDARDLGQKG